MITLRLDVRMEEERVRVFYNGRPVAVAPAAAKAVAVLAPGPHDFACAYGAGGLTVHGVGPAAATAAAVARPPLGVRARGLIERRAFDEALAQLRGAGEAEIMSSPELLVLRIRALQGSQNFDAASEDFRSLLAIGASTTARDTEPPAMRTLLSGFPPAAALSLEEPWLSWLTHHPDVVTMWDPGSLLYDVPHGRWPVELILRVLEDSIAAKRTGSRFPELLEEAKRRASDDPRTAAADALVASTRSEEAQRTEEYRLARLRTYATPQMVEEHFRITLPAVLRNAWAHPQDHPALDLIKLSEKTLGEYLSFSDAVSLEHFHNDASGLPPFMAIARGEGPGETVGLYLAQPRPDGDFAVLRVTRGTRDSIVLEANSSAEWVEPAT